MQQSAVDNNESNSIKRLLMGIIVLLAPIANLIDNYLGVSRSNILIVMLIPILGLVLLHAFQNHFSFRIDKLFLYALLNIGYIVGISIIGTPSATRIIQFSTMCLVLFTIKSFNVKTSDLVYLRKIVNNVVAINLLIFPFHINSVFKFGGIFDNPNSLGWICLCAVYFTQITKETIKEKHYHFLIAVIFATVFISGARASLLACIFLFMSFIIFERKNNTVRLRMYVCFGIVVAASVLIIDYLPNITQYPIGRTIDQLSLKYFNKSINSGRHYIWSEMASLSKQNPIFGLGLSTSYSSVNIRDGRSCHNLFLQTIVQSGYLGLSLLILFLFKIYQRILSNLNPRTVFTACFILSILIHEMFEVSLTQNNWDQGLVFWLIMGIGLSENTIDESTHSHKHAAGNILKKKTDIISGNEAI